jgi:hypothetical protein
MTQSNRSPGHPNVKNNTYFLVLQTRKKEAAGSLNSQHTEKHCRTSMIDWHISSHRFVARCHARTSP